MACDSGVAGVWAALCGLALLIAIVLTAGYWMCVYHHEAAELRPFSAEPSSAIEMILDDLTPAF